MSVVVSGLRKCLMLKGFKKVYKIFLNLLKLHWNKIAIGFYKTETIQSVVKAICFSVERMLKQCLMWDCCKKVDKVLVNQHWKCFEKTLKHCRFICFCFLIVDFNLWNWNKCNIHPWINVTIYQRTLFQIINGKCVSLPQICTVDWRFMPRRILRERISFRKVWSSCVCPAVKTRMSSEASARYWTSPWTLTVIQTH